MRTRRARGPAPLALLALLLTAAPASGAGEQDTSGGVVLARGTVSAAVVADLDGDGGNEVIAVLNPADGTGPLILQAWGERDGAWSSLGRVPIQRWDEDVERSRATRGADAASLMTIRTEAGLQVVIPVTAGGFESPGGGCCLSLSTVTLGPQGLHAELTGRLPDTAAESLTAVDLEADGRDELVVTEYVTQSEDQSPEPRYHLLRQTGSGWERTSLPVDQDAGLYLALADDTDGIPGDDLIFMNAESNGIARVFSEGGELRAEHPGLGVLLDLRRGGWIAAAANGLLVLADGSGIATEEWPRGGLPTRRSSADTAAFPTVFVLGEGPDARIVQLTDNGIDRDVPLGVGVYDLELRLERTIDARPLVQDLWRLSTNPISDLSEVAYGLWPQFGPVPGGVSGRPAMIAAGELLTIAADGSFEVRQARALVGTSPVGTAGRDSGWVVNGPGWFGLSSSVNLYGGGLPEAVVSVVPLDTLLDADAGSASWDLGRATPVILDGEEVLATDGQGFEVTVSGEPGTLVIPVVGRRSATVEIGDEPVTVPIEPGDSEDGNERIEASLFTIAPTGVATGSTWDVAVYRQPPEITASTESELFSLRSTIRGSAPAGSSMTVDGRPVELNADGAFRVDVDSPAWPREVLVVARDPVGNETTQSLEVIGLVDYRGLPWIPIVGVLTVLAGLVLFVRTPNLRPSARLAADGDGRLEEIDGDLV